MSDEPLDDEYDGEFEELEPPRKFAGKKLVMFVVLPLLMLGGGAAAWFAGFLDSGHETKTEVAGEGAAEHEGQPGHDKAAIASSTVFYDLPVMLVNLNSNSRRPSFLKIRVSLELENPGYIARIETLQPRIIDNFQVYLRELRIDDLRGSAGIYRLREELLARVNASVSPAGVKNVLFKEVLVQ